MKRLHEILAFNKEFVRKKEFEAYKTSKYPDKKLVIVSCMDTRLSDLLLKAMNLKNGDAKIIKSAGATVTHPFGSAMRSILVAIYELQAEEICVIAHDGCGMAGIHPEKTIQTMIERGVPRDTIDTIERCGFHLKDWLSGFDSLEESVKQSVDLIRNHPLMLPDIPVHGLIIDPETGRLDTVVEGY